MERKEEGSDNFTVSKEFLQRSRSVKKINTEKKGIS